MKAELFNLLRNERYGWLDRNDIERLNIIRAEVDSGDEDGRPQRLRNAQGEILEIIGPTLDRMHQEATEQVEGAIALHNLTGYEVGIEERDRLAAATQITNTLRDIRTGGRVVDFDEVIDGQFLIEE